MTSLCGRLLALTAAATIAGYGYGCGRMSSLERFGGSIATLQIAEIPPGQTTPSIRTAIERALADRYVSAEVTTVESDDGFRVAFPPYVDGSAEIAALLEAQTRLETAFQLRLAFATRTRNGLTAVDVPPSMGPGQSDTCTYARDGECDESVFCAINTDWSDCAGRRPATLFIEELPIVDGRSLESATYETDLFRLTFTVSGRDALNEASTRDPQGLVAVFLDDAYAGTLRLGEAVTPDGLVVAATGDPWQAELSALAASAIPARLELVQVEQIASPELDGQGSKYPW